MSEHITVVQQGNVLEVGLQRPEKKNALTRAMYAALVSALEMGESSPDIRVLLLHGTADCFTSGNDLNDFLKGSSTDDESPVVRFLRGISRAKKPIVAAVNGLAIGIGTTMLLHCDLVYAGEQTRFQLPFVSLGLCPEAAASLLLPQLAGYHRAAEMLFLGEPFPSQQALETGLVNRIIPAGELLNFAREQARKIAALPPDALAVTKSLLKRGEQARVSETIDLELKLFAERLESPECKEAIAAFFERRPANFSRVP